MRAFLIALSLISLAACAGPAENQPHPFDKYTINSSGQASHDTAPPCSSYGCGRR